MIVDDLDTLGESFLLSVELRYYDSNNVLQGIITDITPKITDWEIPLTN